MSAYYHEFTIGFNWWYIYVPVVMVLFCFFGYKSIKVGLRSDGRKKFYRIRSRFWKILSLISTVILGILLFVESSDGIVQTFDNAFRYEESSPVYSLLLASAAMTFICLIFYGLNLWFVELGQRMRVKKERRIP